MEFNSILDINRVPEREGGRPVYFLDLNLNQIIDRICAVREKNVSSYYYYLPENKDCEEYRREVFEDIKSGEVYDILCDFVKAMEEWEEARVKGGAVRGNLQRAVWFLTEVQVYCEAFVTLYEKLNGLKLQSRGMCGFREYLGQYLESSAFSELQNTMKQLLESMEAFRFQIVYENERMSVSLLNQVQGEMQSDKGNKYDAFLSNAFPGRARSMRTPFEIAPDHSELEQEIIKIIQKFQPDFFKKTRKFYEKFYGYGNETLLQFVKEIEFYLSFRCFELHMQEQGYEFAVPKCTDWAEQWEEKGPEEKGPKEKGTEEKGTEEKQPKEKGTEEKQQEYKQPEQAVRESALPEKQGLSAMQAVGLYDLALACAKGKRKSAGNLNGEAGLRSEGVVSNDMSYLPKERFFVLTGPNQGGKTTFARSLGQLVYFAKMGLDVPAKSASVPYFTDILTHFSVEESVETGRGKLKEELVRLEPMMGANCENAFVIINELFTTAANYDACIMGKRVLQHFLEQKCYGIYVTHLKELAEEAPGIVSLRAMLDESGRQNFEIRRSPAVESANASNQVNKYHLTYEQLKNRLGLKND